MEFNVNIVLGNAAMQSSDNVVDALREIADDLEAHGPDEFTAATIQDANGNTVGSYGLVPEDEVPT